MSVPSGFRLIVACIVSMQLLAAVAAEPIDLLLSPGYAKGQMYDLTFSYQDETDTQLLENSKESAREKKVWGFKLSGVMKVKKVSADGRLLDFDLVLANFEKETDGKTKEVLPKGSRLTVVIEENFKLLLGLNYMGLKDADLQELVILFVSNSPMIPTQLDATMGPRKPVQVGDTWDPGAARTRVLMRVDSGLLDTNPASAKRVLTLKEIKDVDGEPYCVVQATFTGDLKGVPNLGAKVNKGAVKIQHEFTQPVQSTGSVRTLKSLTQMVVQSGRPAKQTNAKLKFSSETSLKLRDDGEAALAAGARPKPAGPRSRPAATEEADAGGGGEVPDGWE